MPADSGITIEEFERPQPPPRRGAREVGILAGEMEALALVRDRREFLTEMEFFESKPISGFSARHGELFDRA